MSIRDLDLQKCTVLQLENPPDGVDLRDHDIVQQTIAK